MLQKKKNAYEVIQKRLANATNRKDFLEIARAFDVIADYADSSEQAQKCREKVEKIEENEIEENRLKENERIYLSAVRSMEKGKQESNPDVALNAIKQAKSTFHWVLDYKDSPEKIAECEQEEERIKSIIQKGIYKTAVEAMQTAKATNSLDEYRRAEDLLKKLNGYQDSFELLKECQGVLSEKESHIGEDLCKGAYQKAEELLQEALLPHNMDRAPNMLRRAAEQFRNLQNYKDSREKYTLCMDKVKEIQKQIQDQPESDEKSNEIRPRYNITIPTQRKPTEREVKIQTLTREKARLEAELPNIRGLFSGGKRRQIESRLSEIAAELERLG